MLSKIYLTADRSEIAMTLKRAPGESVLQEHDYMKVRDRKGILEETQPELTFYLINFEF